MWIKIAKEKQIVRNSKLIENSEISKIILTRLLYKFKLNPIISISNLDYLNFKKKLSFQQWKAKTKDWLKKIIFYRRKRQLKFLQKALHSWKNWNLVIKFHSHRLKQKYFKYLLCFHYFSYKKVLDFFKMNRGTKVFRGFLKNKTDFSNQQIKNLILEKKEIQKKKLIIAILLNNVCLNKKYFNQKKNQEANVFRFL